MCLFAKSYDMDMSYFIFLFALFDCCKQCCFFVFLWCYYSKNDQQKSILSEVWRPGVCSQGVVWLCSPWRWLGRNPFLASFSFCWFEVTYLSLGFIFTLPFLHWFPELTVTLNRVHMKACRTLPRNPGAVPPLKIISLVKYLYCHIRPW